MELPLEIVREIFDFANIRCCICDKKLYPWTIKGYLYIYVCSNNCFKQTCIFQ
jgi:hypothetical protein